MCSRWWHRVQAYNTHSRVTILFGTYGALYFPSFNSTSSRDDLVGCRSPPWPDQHFQLIRSLDRNASYYLFVSPAVYFQVRGFQAIATGPGIVTQTIRKFKNWNATHANVSIRAELNLDFWPLFIVNRPSNDECIERKRQTTQTNSQDYLVPVD